MFGVVTGGKRFDNRRVFGLLVKGSNTPCSVCLQQAKAPRVFPKDMRRHMIKNDFAWAAANRLRIIAEWRRRYGGKVEPGGRMNEKEGR